MSKNEEKFENFERHPFFLSFEAETALHMPVYIYISLRNWVFDKEIAYSHIYPWFEIKKKEE